MAATFPSGIKGSASYPWTSITDTVSNPKASDITDAYDEITAIEQELGTDPAGATEATVKERIAAIEGSYMATGKKRRVNINSVQPDTTSPPTSALLTNTNVIVPVMWFGSTADSKIHFVWHIPYDCDVTQDITLINDCCINTASSGSNVKLELWYFVGASNGDTIGSTPEFSDSSNFIAVNTWGAKEIRRDSSLAISASKITSYDTLFITLLRDVSDETTQYTDDFGIINIAMEYYADNV